MTGVKLDTNTSRFTENTIFMPTAHCLRQAWKTRRQIVDAYIMMIDVYDVHNGQFIGLRFFSQFV